MILNRQRDVRVALPALHGFLRRVAHAVKIAPQSVTVALLTDREMARLNRRFRGKPNSTDVLSFPADDGAGVLSRSSGNGVRRASPRKRKSLTSSTSVTSATSFLGDIAISPATARRNARRFGRTLPEELRILILHGVLHLMGYDHETDRGQMDRLEAKLRRRLGIA